VVGFELHLIFILSFCYFFHVTRLSLRALLSILHVWFNSSARCRGRVQVGMSFFLQVIYTTLLLYCFLYVVAKFIFKCGKSFGKVWPFVLLIYLIVELTLFESKLGKSIIDLCHVSLLACNLVSTP